LTARAALLACCALLGGCYSIRYHTRQEPEAAPAYDRWHHDVVFGSVEVSDPVDLSAICPRGVAVVESEVSAGNRAANLATLWAPWFPSTVRVTCAKPTLKAHRIAVLKLVARTGIEPAAAEVLTDALVGQMRKRSGLSVLSPTDVSAMIGFEREKALLGCSDASCLSEIAGAMGADRLISGNLGRIGGSLVVYLTSVDPKRARVVATVSERLTRASDEAFLDALPGFVDQLLAEAPVEKP
jgi:hypothetical protein